MSKSTSQKATIVDGKLILSLPDAQMPVVWQMDLDKAQSASFTVQEDKKKKTFALVSKTSDNDADEIAIFEDKQDAVDALMETSNTLQSAHGQIKPDGVPTTKMAANKSVKPDTSDKLGAFLALVLVLVLVLIWMVSASGRITPIDGDISVTGTTTSPANARDSAGVPVSADDFLSNR